MGQINLNNFKVITDKLNTFFVDNKFMVASEIPTEGEFKVGDIIINNGSTNVDEPMWICVEAGNPGTWTVFNSGGGSGGRLSTARNRVVLNGESKSEVSIGISGFNKASGVLMVFINSRFMTEGVDYEINDDSTKILAIGEAWNEELSSEFEIEMIVFKMKGEEGVVSSVNEIVKLKNTVIVNEAVNEVEIGIDGFNEGDDLTVYRNSVYMIEGIDYEIQGSKIVSLKGAWNAEGGSDYKFTFEVLKTVAKVNPDAVVGMEHLTDDVKEAIEAAGNIDLSEYATKEELNNIDLSGKQDKTDESLLTESKDVIGAINELFQSANNGKELIASAIGEPLNAEDTFQAMSTDINGLLSTFKTNMMNNGITVESSDRFKSLIDKIATMVEEGEGKGIHFASGTKTNFNVSDEYFDGVTTVVDMGIEFTPDIVFFTCESISSSKFNPITNITVSSSISNSSDTNAVFRGNTGNSVVMYITNISSTSFDLCSKGSISFTGMVWYAIGVGEEDTTLRDSLASILEEEGVSVTEEDDMASLITKVDEEFTNDNNAISEMETDAENTRSTLAGLMTEGGYDITGNEDINSLLDLLTVSGISVGEIKQIACGSRHTMIVKNDGSLWATGYASDGQLGIGTWSSQDAIKVNTFTQVTTNINNDVKKVACGYEHTMILKNDGSLWACGLNDYGELGISSDGVKNYVTQVTTNINNDVKDVICGMYHTFILKNDGTVWATGDNGYGQLGLGNTTSKSTFTQITTNISDIKQIDCGYMHTMILKNDGSVWSCGYNIDGQLGLGTNTNTNTFTQVTTNINNDVKKVICSGSTTYILKNNGSLWGCGMNESGQLGINNYTSQNKFTQITTNINNDVKDVYGTNSSSHTFIIKNDGSLWSCGNNYYSQLGLGDANNRSVFTQVTTNAGSNISITMASSSTIILKNNENIFTCGYNANGEFGTGDFNNIVSFTPITKPGVVF